MTLTTTAKRSDVERISRDLNMVADIEANRGTVSVSVRGDRAFTALASELRREGFSVIAGRLRDTSDGPRSYATASSHIRKY